MDHRRRGGGPDRPPRLGPPARPRVGRADYIAAFDVFSLVSREDAFPLAFMEAAAVGVPTVCFDGAVEGGCEFVEADAGRVVPYLDLDAMAERVLEFLRGPRTA